MDTKPEQDDSENPFSENYNENSEQPEKNYSYGGSVLLAVFITCYLGFEIWYQWNFKGKIYVQIAVASLILTFFLLVWILSAISEWFRKQWGTLGSLFMFFAGFLVMLVISYFFNPEARHDRIVTRFENHIQDYLKINPVDKEDAPKILIGKVAVIEIGRKKLPDITSDRLQRNIRADSPEEVTTVIFLKWAKKKLPKIKKAIVDTCVLTAVYLPQNEITVEKHFEAEWKEVLHKPKGKIWMGYLDDTIIYRYIRNLPTRNK